MIHVVIPTIKSLTEYVDSVACDCLIKILQREPIDHNFSFNTEIIPFNKKGISTHYNNLINDSKYSDDDTVVVMHDDIEIHDAFFVQKLRKAHETYDIVGLAGAASQNYVNASTPAWHLCMNQRGDGRGFLSHAIPKDVGNYPFPYINSSYFGPSPAEVVFVDGVFISFKIKSLRASGVRFNEKYTFHHYDMAMCADAKRAGLKIGVFPIFGIHHGLGEFNSDPLWHTLATEFKQDYGNYSMSI